MRMVYDVLIDIGDGAERLQTFESKKEAEKYFIKEKCDKEFTYINECIIYYSYEEYREARRIGAAE